MVALCVACGSRFTVPKVSGSDPDLIPDRELLDGSFFPGLAAERVRAASAKGAAASPADAPAGPSVAASALPQPTWRGNRPVWSYAVLGSAITLLVVLAGVFILNGRGSWEDRGRVAVRDLKAQAEALALQGRVREAYDTYRQIDQLVAGHEIRDPELRGQVARADAARDDLFKVLFSEVKDRQAVAEATTGPTTKTTAVAMVTKPRQAATKPSTGPLEPRVEVTAPPDTDVAPATQQAIVHDWPEYLPRVITTRPVARPAIAATTTRPSNPPPTTAAVASATRPARDGGTARVALNIQKRPAVTTDLTDEQIGASIQGGVNHLISLFQDGQLHGGGIRNDGYQTGLNALCVYALLQSSYAIKDERLNVKGPFVRNLIDHMKAMPADNGPVTYARGIRATALALLARPEDKAALAKDVAYLLGSHMNGAYTYQAIARGGRGGGSPGRFEGMWDNSNSQYGLLGVWSAAEIGAEVNSTYWAAVENHWTKCQLDDGSWDYAGYNRGGGGRISMSVAGVASLFVTHDYLDAPLIGSSVGREPFSKALAKGLAHLEFGDNAVNISGGYTLYGLERAGLASGFKFFGDHDWYRELAAAVIRAQDMDGSWGNEVETAYHLLFLARGRHPILMNKLRYDGYWANRPRDVSNLARFGSRELERPLNWQVVPITRDWTDWTDSPILEISTHTAANFSDAEIEKIRNFVDAGGLLFTQADAGKPEADKWAQELARKLFPLYEMRDLPDDHEIYSILYKPSPHPVLRGVSNGARLLMVHSPTDVTQYWQMRQDKTRRSLFELGINLFLYASGKGDLRNRIASTYIPAQGPATGGKLSALRIKYPGNWDPEPVAWGRFARYFQQETDVALDVRAVDLDRLDFKVAPFAHWTGTHAYTATDAEVAAIRKFVGDGGVLLIEPCGGSGEFFESARQALQRAFPEAHGQLISKTSPMLTASGPGMDDLTIPAVRNYVKSKGLGTSGRLDELRFGKGVVIYNPLDITSGLLGTHTWGILGFEPAYASSLLKNVLLWSAAGMPADERR